MKISASVYSSKDRDIEDLVKDLDQYNIDSFHIDCNDNLQVFDDIAKIRKISRTPIDLHIISERPEQYYDQIDAHKIEMVQFQFENLGKPLNLKPNGITSYGLSIMSDTPVEVFEPYAGDCDFILMMTTIPGQSGGTFRKDNFKKIRKFRNTFPGKRIHVDGGVNAEVSFILRYMGVHSVVSGSYLVNHSSIGAAMLNLRLEDVHSQYQIRDFMIEKEDLPILPYHKTSFVEVLQTIEKYKFGFVFFSDADGKFAGLASNADVRKGLLKNLADLNQTRLEDITNFKPVSLQEDATISEMLYLIQSKKFPVNFLPVLNGEHRIAGAVTFFNLIKGES
ncbi:MAG: CBS domain-containing protein [Cyclobacteriaceae bacterium]|nr:CBS domain-containing protein [Cyclobacteriaceae bacterium]